MPSILVPFLPQTPQDPGWLPKGSKITTNKIMFTFKSALIDMKKIVATTTTTKNDVPEKVTPEENFTLTEVSDIS